MKVPSAAERPLHWVGSSKKDLLSFPEEVVNDIGYALGAVQLGGTVPSAKPWKAEGTGVFEIVADSAGQRIGPSIRSDSRRQCMCCIAFRKSPRPATVPQRPIST